MLDLYERRTIDRLLYMGFLGYLVSPARVERSTSARSIQHFAPHAGAIRQSPGGSHQGTGDSTKPTAAPALPQLPRSHQRVYPSSTSPRRADVFLLAITGQLPSSQAPQARAERSTSARTPQHLIRRATLAPALEALPGRAERSTAALNTQHIVQQAICAPAQAARAPAGAATAPAMGPGHQNTVGGHQKPKERRLLKVMSWHVLYVAFSRKIPPLSWELQLLHWHLYCSAEQHKDRAGPQAQHVSKASKFLFLAFKVREGHSHGGTI